MLKFFFEIFGIPLMIIVIFVATLPIFAGKLDEKEFAPEAYIKVVDVLPKNDVIVFSDNLPKNQVKSEFRKIIIDLSEQKMFLHDGDVVIGEFLVSTGKTGMETPTGIFQIYEKRARAWSRMAGLWMPYWIMIDPIRGIGIHELPEWPNGYKEGTYHLGLPVSHGCIRLGIGSAEFVYNWAEVGMSVEIVK